MDNKMKDTNIGMKVEGESLARKPTPEEHKLMQLEQESANPPAKNSGSKQEKKSEKKRKRTLPVPDEMDLAVAKLAKSTTNKSYYQKNKARLLAQRKRRHEAKKEEENKKAREKARASYAANPEPKKQQSRDRAKAKREQAKEQQLGGQKNGQGNLGNFGLMVSMMDSNSRKAVKKAKEVDQRTRWFY